MDASTRKARQVAYERWSRLPVFLCGSLFLVGLVEVVMDAGDTRSGQILMVVAWIGFVIDLVARWILDDSPRTFPRRHWFAFIAVLIPIFRALFVFYIFIRLARGRTRLQTKIQYYAAYLTILVITFGAALVLGAERDYPGSNIKTYGEAVWWACVTVTLMLFNGVAIISVITATISSRFVSDPDKGELPVTLDLVDERLERIEAALALLTARGGTDPDAPPTGPVPPRAGDDPSAPAS